MHMMAAAGHRPQPDGPLTQPQQSCCGPHNEELLGSNGVTLGAQCSDNRLHMLAESRRALCDPGAETTYLGWILQEGGCNLHRNGGQHG